MIREYVKNLRIIKEQTAERVASYNSIFSNLAVKKSNTNRIELLNILTKITTEQQTAEEDEKSIKKEISKKLQRYLSKEYTEEEIINNLNDFTLDLIDVIEKMTQEEKKEEISQSENSTQEDPPKEEIHTEEEEDIEK